MAEEKYIKQQYLDFDEYLRQGEPSISSSPTAEILADGKWNCTNK